MPYIVWLVKSVAYIGLERFCFNGGHGKAFLGIKVGNLGYQLGYLQGSFIPPAGGIHNKNSTKEYFLPKHTALSHPL